MDVPLHLRLACARRFDDVYKDRKPVRYDAQPPCRGSPHIGKDFECDGRQWLSSLVAALGPSQDGTAASYADPAVNASFISPAGATARVEASAPSASHNLDPQPQSQRTSLTSSSRTVRSPPDIPFEPHAQEATRVESAVQASVVIEVEADAAARARAVRVSEELAGTHEVLLADITTALERRVRECVLKTAALDEARQQLICAFQLPSVTSPASSACPPHPVPRAPSAAVASHASTAPPPQAQWTKEEARTRAEATTYMASERDAADGELVDGPVQVPAARAAAADVAVRPPWLSANRTDASLSDDVRKEMALHLYALRRQVKQLHGRLEAHESTHYRHINALRAAQKQSRTSSSPPVRVEIVKAYEDDPVPYRKGPWREADFAAARRSGPDRSAGGMKKDAAGDESYTSDDFTEVTSRVSSVVSGGDGSSSSVSSTEKLFRQRQAAALRARGQRLVAHSAAVHAAGPSRNYRSASSSGDSSASTNTSSYSSRTTTATTSMDTDSESA
ncbi:hypothetical protein LSCM1_03180 [Leishmania martiniquensis]|uniref:Uncharacterized protein n=1 Tax=Leishmania martiniquensis TaxID=1580590 RepID=A0A836KQF4_9TRYP|nr:hypothetical protein LSCM1_03180 [Leishmania martiniquensis]